MPLTDADIDRIEAEASNPDRFDVLALILEVRRLRAAQAPDPVPPWRYPWMTLAQVAAQTTSSPDGTRK